MDRRSNCSTVNLMFRGTLCKAFSFLFVTGFLAATIGFLCYNFVKDVKEDIAILRTEMYQLKNYDKKLDEMHMDIKKTLKEYLNRHFMDTEVSIKEHVQHEMEIYDADKTGLADYALESAGGEIVTTRNTLPYSEDDEEMSFLGVSLCGVQNGARKIIQPHSFPGDCWSFKGHNGAVVIKLIGHVLVTSVSLEHLPASVSPTGDTSSAPKDFSIWGIDSLDDQNNVFFFGKFSYDKAGAPLQTFKVQHESTRAYPMVEMKVESNHGNDVYTCVYRLRIHGTLQNGKIRRA